MAKHRDAAHPWYGLGRWKKRRKAQLAAHPLCAFCLQKCLAVPATTADHIVPHNGDRAKFEYGTLQSLCTPCHDSIKHTIEVRGYSTAIGRDGWPTDPRHPAYAKRF
jgi:5-methylcytosine-specific restriction protein A